MDIQITKSQLIKQKNKDQINPLESSSKLLLQPGSPNLNSNSNSNSNQNLPFPPLSKKFSNPQSPVLLGHENKQNQNNGINQNLGLNQNQSQIQKHRVNRSEFSEQVQSELKNNGNNKDLSQFCYAWKSEAGFSVLLIEKLSLIVRNYFKMLPQISKRLEQIQILVVYNKALLEILNKFQDHQNKILHKLHTMEQFNIKIMRQLCNLKNKQFKAPQIKLQQSIFSKFSLKNLKYDPHPKQSYTLNQQTNQKILNIFRNHLLLPMPAILPKIQQTIQELSSKQKSIVMENNIHDLEQLRHRVYQYHKEIKDFTDENMLDLYELKLSIKKQFRQLQIGRFDPSGQQQEKLFVQEVMRIQMGLNNVQQNQLQNYLRKQKQIRKRMRKQRIKEQQEFNRMCEKLQSQNLQYMKDISSKKQKIKSLEDELTKLKTNNQVKMMRMKNNRSLYLSNGDQSIIDQEHRSSRKMSKETILSMQKQINRLKQENQAQSQVIAQYKSKQQKKFQVLKNLRNHAKNKKIFIDEGWQDVKIMSFLVQKLGEYAAQNDEIDLVNENNAFLSPSSNNMMNDLPTSPNMKSTQSFSSAIVLNQDKFLKTIKQTENEDGQLQIQMRNKEIQKFSKQTEQLEKKNDENKKLIQKLNFSLKQLETDIKLKNFKINQLVKQYERYQALIKQLRIENQSLRFKFYCSEKLNQNMIQVIQQMQAQVLNPNKHERVIDGLFGRFQQLLDEYNNQIENSEKEYQINRLINIQMDGVRQQNSQCSKNNYDDNISVASLKSRVYKKKEKRQSDLISLKDNKQDDSRIIKENMLKKIKSYNSLNDQLVENQLQKQLQAQRKAFSPKKLQIRLKYQPQRYKNHSDMSEDLHFDSQNLNKMVVQKKSQTEIGYQQVDQRNVNFCVNEIKIIKTEHNIELNQKQKKLGKSEFLRINKSQNGKQETVKKQIQKQMESILQYLVNKDIKQQNIKQKQISKQSTEKKQNKNKSVQIEQKSGRQSMAQKSTIKQKYEANKKVKRRMEKMEAEFNKILDNKNKQQSFNSSSRQDQSLDEDSRYNKQKQKKSFMKQISHKEEEGQNRQSEKDLERGNKILQDYPLIVSENYLKLEKMKKFQTPSGQNQNSEQRQIQFISQRSSQCLPDSKQINLNVYTNERNNQIQNINLTYSSKTSNYQSSNLQLNNNKNENENKESAIDVRVFTKNKQSNQKRIGSAGNRPDFEEDRLSQGKMVKNNHDNFDQRFRNTFGVQIQNHDRIVENIRKLSDFSDALDFAELYERYKQALKCLDIAEATNRMYEINYQNFIAQLQEKEKSQKYSIQEQVFYLKTLVEQQKKRIQQDDVKFNESINAHIKSSQDLINQQLKNLRQEYKKNNVGPAKMKFF